MAGRAAVIVDEDGASSAHGIAAWLRTEGVEAEALEGGFAAWQAAGLPTLRVARLPHRDAHGRTVWLYESDGEPAGAVAMTEARRTYQRARSEGRLAHEHIAGGDHTFSQSAARDEVIRRLRGHFKRTWKPEAP